jgi:hypothetical protein
MKPFAKIILSKSKNISEFTRTLKSKGIKVTYRTVQNWIDDPSKIQSKNIPVILDVLQIQANDFLSIVKYDQKCVHDISSQE